MEGSGIAAGSANSSKYCSQQSSIVCTANRYRNSSGPLLLWSRPRTPLGRRSICCGALELDLTTRKSSAYVALEQDILFLVPASMEIDADLFEARVKHIQTTLQSRLPREQHPQSLFEELDSVLALYGGDYLPDDLYEDWALRRRDRLRRAYSWLLEQAAKVAIASSQGQRASEYLRSLLEQNATDESMHRELMLLYARMGQRSEALNQYHLLRETLREELHTTPLPETLELYRAIQTGRIVPDLSAFHQLSSQKPVVELLDAPIHTHAHAVPDDHSHGASRVALASPTRQDNERETTAVFAPAPQRVLVGRGEELQRLRQAFSSAREGQSRIFVVSGEAGIGKTHLARVFSSWIEEQQATIMWGACYEMSGALPYQPLIDMLTAHMRMSSPEQLRIVLGKSAVDLAKIMPELRTTLPDLPPPEHFGPEVERRNLYNAVAGYLHTIASSRPLLVVLDDLQWVDTATTQLFSYIFQQESGQTTTRSALPFFLLLYRADEVHESHPLRDLLGTQLRTGQAEEVRLKRLKEEEVHQLLTQMAGHEVRAVFSEEIYKYTEGNPLFIGEAIRTLIEEGKIKKIGERWQTTIALRDLALPQRVRIVIERRLAYLSPDCRMTPAYGALFGRQFHSSLLCRVRNLPEERIAEHVDEAIRSHILMALDEDAASQDADLIFTHDKIREVLALWLNPLRRRTAHRQIAQAIESLYASRLQLYYNTLAYHYQRASRPARSGKIWERRRKRPKVAWMSLFRFIGWAGRATPSILLSARLSAWNACLRRSACWRRRTCNGASPP